MALQGCFGCLKFLVFVVNFLFWLTGLGVMAIGLWLLFDQQLYLQGVSAGGDHNSYVIGTYIVLGLGMMVTLVGFLGCCGSWKESTWMLGTFFVFLIIILCGEIAVGVLVYYKIGPYPDIIKSFVDTTVMKKYHTNSTAIVHTFDVMQQQLECCGSESPQDWSKSIYNNGDSFLEIGIRNINKSEFNIPESCCLDKISSTECKQAVRGVRRGTSPTQIYQEGCTEKLIAFFEDNAIFFIAAASGVAVIQIIGMIFSLCLCCALKRIDDYKA